MSFRSNTHFEPHRGGDDMTISKAIDKLGAYTPAILVLALWLALFPLRLVVLLLLPTDARWSDHRLSKVRAFFEFERQINQY